MNETVSNDKPVHQADAVKVQPGEIVPAKVEANEKCERETPHEAKNIVIIPLILKTANANSVTSRSGSGLALEQPESELASRASPEPVQHASSDQELTKSESVELTIEMDLSIPHSNQVNAEEHSSDASEPGWSIPGNVRGNKKPAKLDQDSVKPECDESSLDGPESVKTVFPTEKEPLMSIASGTKTVLTGKEAGDSQLSKPSPTELVKQVSYATKVVKPESDQHKPASTKAEEFAQVTIVLEANQSSQEPAEPVMNVHSKADPEKVNLTPNSTCRKNSGQEELVSVSPSVTEFQRLNLPVESGKETDKNGECGVKTNSVNAIEEERKAVGNGKENSSSSLTNVYMKKCNANEMIQRLDEIDPGHKLRSLCKKGDAEALEEFLKNSVDLNVVSDEGWTCLHEIITHECQFTDVARILLSHGASVNTQDLHGDSPLHSCLLYHCTENIKLLLSYGADLELTNSSGRKPIHVANDEESLKLLLDHGANVNAADNMGNTCLHYAVVAKDKDRVKLLLSAKNKSDVSVKNASGSTPLHLASEPEIASLLLEAAADPNAVDLAGNSPLHLAVRGRHKEVVRHLLEKKADPNLINSHGKIPVTLARDKEMKNILSGKASSPVTSNGVMSMSTTPTAIQSRKRPYSPSVVTNEMSTPTTTAAIAKNSPSSILKKVRRVSNDNGERTSRLRFSDINEYNCIDGDQCFSLSKRVKVRPIYSEPTFSSDDEF